MSMLQHLHAVGTNFTHEGYQALLERGVHPSQLKKLYLFSDYTLGCMQDALPLLRYLRAAPPGLALLPDPVPRGWDAPVMCLVKAALCERSAVSDGDVLS